MRNIILVVIIFCLTIASAWYMETTDHSEHSKKGSKKEKTEQVKKKNQANDLNIKNQKDLSKVIYSHKDEQTKMNAYNEAVDHGIIPKSNHYQEAVKAYEESVWLKNNQ
ncbi:hypothetical protein [Mammaliicoccus sp. Dog046]|uniref:hypothetical protein n=1 Tax=Mammaliicoccus sp. Dog046 TaxID=3034233 RepID=UPI002B25807F|nr:hypothetical protein [Mammaliicoccus sp. Dog046]WQK85141.1 hypothetical protein P3U32_10985 [Mammaliicoccus sp. Dog046]